MRKHLVYTWTALVGIASSLPAVAATFHGLDMPAHYNSRVTALSPDGSVVMGEMWEPGMPSETFRWTAQDGLSRQADLQGWGGYAWPYAMSYEGSTVVGYDTNPGYSGGHAFKWTSSTGRVYLDDPAMVVQSEPWGLSWDGKTIVGYRYLTGQNTTQAVIWQDGNTLPLDVTPGNLGTYATNIASNGTVVGSTTWWPGPARPFRWTPETGIRFIDFPELAHFDSGLRISGDGSTIIGNWSVEGVGSEGFVWNESMGAIGLGDLPGDVYGSNAAGVSANGQIIIGSSSTGSFDTGEGLLFHTTTAFIWDRDHGMRSLPDVLQLEYGLDLHGWELWEATAISADGRTIVGNGINPDGYYRTWIVEMPEPSSGFLFALVAMFSSRRRQLTDRA